MTTREKSRQTVDDLIGAYRACAADANPDHAFLAAFRALRAFFLAWDPPPKIDENGDHFLLCRRLCAALDPVGFEPGTPEADGLLDAAADDLYLALQDGLEDLEVIGQGRESALEGGGYLAVDLVERRVVYNAEAPVVVGWSQPIRREAPKVGRNHPCPCGSGKKYKRCHLGAEAAPATVKGDA